MDQKFTCNGTPQVLSPRPEIGGKLLTLEAVDTIMEHHNRAILPVTGDCLEGAGLMDSGWVAVDFTRFPAPPSKGHEDLCLCYAVYPGQRNPAVMCKAYLGVWGPWQMVGTRYDLTKGKHPYNCGMEAQRIFGVVFASWDADGNLLWARDPHSFPEQLGITPTIHGGNISDPMPLPGGGGGAEKYEETGLSASPRQICFLEGKGFLHVGQWQFEPAKHMIDRIAANGWRVPRDVNPAEYIPSEYIGTRVTA